MRDGLVNWNKMRQLARHCAIVTESPRLRPDSANSNDFERYVMKLPVYSLESEEVRVQTHRQDLYD